jgi:transposase-like protein
MRVRQWQNRPLDQVYPIVYVDCLVVKVRENQRVLNKALYLALGVDMDGQKDLLGMWISQNEGAKFWLAVFTEFQNRGVKDIFIACMDGLTGLPEAVETRLTAHAHPIVYGAYGAQLAQICVLQTPQRNRGFPETNLWSGYRDRSAGVSRTLCREVGSALS